MIFKTFDRLAYDYSVRPLFCAVELYISRAEPHLQAAGAGDDIHARIADKTCNKHTVGVVMYFSGSALLHDTPLIHYYDIGSHRHGLDLIVRHIDESRFEGIVQLNEFSAHIAAQFCVQVGERLVHQKTFRHL